jgi:hypothetical protein
MLTGAGSSYNYNGNNAVAPDVNASIPTTDTGTTAKNGESKGTGTLRTQSFWTDTDTDTLGFNSGTEKPWSFTSVTGRGYPTLANVGGQ